MGIGSGKGEDKVRNAVKAAIESPLLETTVAGAKAILLNVTGGYDMSMKEVNEAAEQVQGVADKDAIIIFGAAVSEELQDQMNVTVIATGFENQPGNYAASATFTENGFKKGSTEGFAEAAEGENGEDVDPEESEADTENPEAVEADGPETAPQQEPVQEESKARTFSNLMEELEQEKDGRKKSSRFDIPSFLK